MSGKTAVSKELNDRHRRLLQAATKQTPNRCAGAPRAAPPPPPRPPRPRARPRARARAGDLEGRERMVGEVEGGGSS